MTDFEAAHDSTRVIFLDFDGVLIPQHYTEHSLPAHFSPAVVAALNSLTAQTGAIIVISSSRKQLHTLGSLRDLLAAQGVAGIIRDMTPTLDVTSGESRGKEIKNWLADHSYVQHYVILDDNPEWVLPWHNRVVAVDPDQGLTADDARRAIELLSDD